MYSKNRIAWDDYTISRIHVKLPTHFGSASTRMFKHYLYPCVARLFYVDHINTINIISLKTFGLFWCFYLRMKND